MPVTIEEKRKKLDELRDKIYEEAERFDGLRTLPTDKRGSNWETETRQAAQAVRDLDTVITGIDRSVRLEWEDDQRAKGGSGEGGAGPDGATRNVGRGEFRTAGQLVTENENLIDWCKRTKGSGTSESIPVNFQRQRLMEVRTLLTLAGSDLTPADGVDAGLFVPRGTPFLPATAQDRRRLFVADILPHSPTDLVSIPYIREHLPRTNEEGAQMVAEGDLKPEVTMQFEPADAPVRKIAAWLPCTSEILTDAPTLRSYIDARLAYMVDLREEEQILNGDGTGTNILGVRNCPGLQFVVPVGQNPPDAAHTTVAGDNAVSVAKAFALIENVDGEIDGVAMNALDYWPMITRRTNTAGAFDPGISPWSGVPNSLWGVPTVRTRSMPIGKALAGSWRIGAQIFDKEETVIRVGNQHADYFIRNQVAILAEERIALAIFRPDLFVEVDFA